MHTHPRALLTLAFRSDVDAAKKEGVADDFRPFNFLPNELSEDHAELWLPLRVRSRWRRLAL